MLNAHPLAARRAIRWSHILAAFAFVAGLTALGLSSPAPAQTAGQEPAQLGPAGQPGAAMLEVPVGKSQTIRTETPFSQVLVGDPEVADVMTMSDRTLYVLGKKLGSTSLTLQGPNRRPIAIYDLVVGLDTGGLKARLNDVLPGEPIEVRTANDSLLLSGTVSSAGVAARAAALAERYAPEKVVNMLSVAGSQQVMLAVRFAEVRRSVVKELGLRDIEFGVLGGNQTSVLPVDVPASSLLGLIGSNPASLLSATGVLLDGRVGLGAAFDALEENGLVRTLAEPNLIALSGETANFLAGGEFPVPVARSNDNGSDTITIEFKPFGVSLAFTPTVLNGELINVVVSPEVSQIDRTVSITLQGFNIPGLSTRRATTTVELRDGQSFAIAGLISSNFTNAVNQVPLLGDVPVLGSLFRSTAFQRNETELVILVTTHLVAPTSPAALAVPTDRMALPDQAELFLLGKVTGELPPGALSGGGLQGSYGHILK